MNSITYAIAYCLAILVVNVLSSDYHFLSESKELLAQPFYFGYKTWNDFLIMEITLQNISPSVTAVHLVYNHPYHWSKTIKIIKDKKSSVVKFMILKQITYDHIVVDVTLYSRERLCNTTKIAEGRDVNNLDDNHFYEQHSPKYYHTTGYCLAPKICEIVVDFKNKCQEQRSSTHSNCYIDESQYICTFIKPQDTLIYTFYQTYDNSSFLGPAPEIKAKVTRIFIELELFDNNTSVNVLRRPKTMTSRNQNTILWSNKLSLHAKDISTDYSSVPKRNYSETKNVEYSCQRDDYRTNHKVHVGIINTDNKITTQDEKLIKRNFTSADNGTILCCLYYKTTYKGEELHVTRVVENKTLLIFEPQEYRPTNPTEIEGQTKASQTGWLIYLVPSFLGICVLVMALYIIKQNRCCTNSHPPEDTLELENTATQNQVLYANLDLVRDENQSQRQNEEPHYANIVGVLHPLS